MLNIYSMTGRLGFISGNRTQMKNIFKALAIVLFMATAIIPATAKKQVLTEKEQAKIEKQAEKEAKKVAKQLKKQGWQIEQTGLMENIIGRHIAKMQLDNLQERVGTAVDRKTRSGCRKQIQNDVANAYARENSGVVKGKVSGKDRFIGEDETEDFIGQYETRLAMEIAGELTESYSLYKKNPDGTYDMMIYYLVNPENSHAAKVRAARYAMEIQKLDEEWCNSIMDAINSDDEE